jgi:hypothetical protein
MYEVNLHTSPNRLFDLDLPLLRQPKEVLEALRTKRPVTENLTGSIADYTYSDTLGQFLHPETSIRSLVKEKNQVERLRNSGIDGVRYFDAASRKANEGTSNYVMFDDKLIELLRRYGLLGMVGGGAAAAGGKQAPSEEQTDYAQGGSVDSAPVYDPAVIAAIAASITEDNYA